MSIDRIRPVGGIPDKTPDDERFRRFRQQPKDLDDAADDAATEAKKRPDEPGSNLDLRV